MVVGLGLVVSFAAVAVEAATFDRISASAIITSSSFHSNTKEEEEKTLGGGVTYVKRTVDDSA